MNEWLQYAYQFHFLRPYWLLASLPAVFIVVLLWRHKSAFGVWERVISPHLLPHLMAGQRSSRNRTPFVLLLIAWLLTSIAMAGPTWRELPQPIQKKVNAQVIILDLSLSMYAKDLAPSRLLRAQLKLTDILKRTKEGMTALVVYAGTPHVVTPLTDDTNTILSMVNSLSPEIMPVKGSDPVAAVKKALQLLQQGGFNSGRLLLITDEIPADFVPALKDDIDSSTPLSILGLGTERGAPIQLPDGSFIKETDGSIVVPKLDVSALKQAVTALDGRFSTITTSDKDINYLFAEDWSFAPSELEQAGRKFDVWEESGHWLVLLILPLAAMGYRKGWLGSMLPPALLATWFSVQPTPGYALDWQDLWETKDQQGKQLLEQDKPKAAADTFKNPSWKAHSHYQNGDLKNAEKWWRESGKADDFYNLGNAQAQQQQLQAAIDSYQKALDLDPEMKDAQSNLALVKELLEQQKQEQKQQDQKDKDQQSEDQQDSDSDQKNESDQQNQQSDESEKQQDSQQESPSSDQGEQQDNQDPRQPEQSPEQPSEQEQQAEQQSKPGEQDQEQEQQQPQSAVPQDAERSEDQQALEQWLRRVPDDPGGLLRRKFQQESQNRQNNAPSGDTAW